MSIEAIQKRVAAKKEQAANANAVDVLMELSHEISNFARGFKGKVRHTYIASPAASDMFGLSVSGKSLYLGVPERLMDGFMEMQWTNVSYFPGKPGLFLRFYYGAKNREREVALRLMARSSRTEIMPAFDSIRIIRMRPDGTAYPESHQHYFDLPLKKITGMEWER